MNIANVHYVSTNNEYSAVQIVQTTFVFGFFRKKTKEPKSSVIISRGMISIPSSVTCTRTPSCLWSSRTDPNSWVSRYLISKWSSWIRWISHPWLCQRCQRRLTYLKSPRAISLFPTPVQSERKSKRYQESPTRHTVLKCRWYDAR